METEMVRTLLADGHAVVCAGIRNALRDLSYLDIVGEVGNGTDLMQALVDTQPDLLLIDVTMPNFEPVAATRQIRARYPELRIPVVSAYDDDMYVQGLLSAGVDGYHLKDQPLSDLRLAVERVLSGERWISSSLLDKLVHSAQPPAEVESVLVGHPAVTEAAAIGIPDEVKGQAVVAFAVLQAGAEPGDALRTELKSWVAKEMGKPLAPKDIRFVADIPRTRNAKVMRRVIRAAYLGEEPGDLSALVNPEAVEEIRRAA